MRAGRLLLHITAYYLIIALAVFLAKFIQLLCDRHLHEPRQRRVQFADEQVDLPRGHDIGRQEPQHRLVRGRVALDPQAWILHLQLVQHFEEPLLVALLLRLDRDGVHRRRELKGPQADVIFVGVGQMSDEDLEGLEQVRGWQQDFYRQLHQHPELSHQEVRTAAAVAAPRAP